MENLTNQLSNVSSYDVKKYVRKAQNAVSNVTDMEAKVREATNNEPWGTPTTVMQQIAEGTNNYQQFHEIMPFVYRRFSEKSASEWRQIYKSLQLLDFLVRNGSERVVDYARSHISVIEMSRHFSYIDSKGVDQGASIRKRSEELVSLSNSNKKLRAERKQAKQSNAKTQAISSGSLSGGTARFGGFGRSGTTGVYANPEFETSTPGFGDAGGFGGSGSRYGGLSSETYYRNRAAHAASLGSTNGSSESVDQPDNDEFEEYEVSGSAAAASSSGHAAIANNEEDDDFADFQSAPTAGTSAAATPAKPVTANILDSFDAPAPQPTVASTTHNPSATPVAAAASSTASAAPAGKPAAAAAPSMDSFDSSWESSKTYTPKTTAQNTAQSAQPAFSGTPASSAKPAETDLFSTSTTTTASTPAAKTTPSSQNEVVDLLSF